MAHAPTPSITLTIAVAKVQPPTYYELQECLTDQYDHMMMGLYTVLKMLYITVLNVLLYSLVEVHYYTVTMYFYYVLHFLVSKSNFNLSFLTICILSVK